MSGISCTPYYGDDDESFLVFIQTKRKARKEHTCYECCNAIKKGEIYEKSSGFYDGQWDHYKTCCRCLDLHEALSDFSCYTQAHYRQFGSLVEDMEQYIQDCMIPNLKQTFLAIPYYKKLVRVKRGF